MLIDVDSNEVVFEGLSMPHSPRWHRGALYLLDSGRGTFARVDLAGGRLEEIAFCPGYARGLAFAGTYAVVGLSRPRGSPGSVETLTGLELDDALARRNVEPRAGLLVIDLRSGDIVHWLRLDGVVSELYDVAVLPTVKRPMALGFKTDEIRRTLRIKGPESDG